MAHRWLRVGFVLVLVSTAASAQPAAPSAPSAPGRKPPKRDFTAEISAIAGTDLQAAAKAAEALGTYDAPAAHDALLDALALGVPNAVAVPALAALATHPAPPDVPALRRYAGHHDVSVRAQAVTSLAVYPDPEARKTIAAALHDPQRTVRDAAAGAAARGRVRDAVEPMLLLLAKGEEASARALAALADPELARRIADHLGVVPDPSLARCLGAILKRTDFGPDPARVEIVRAIAKIQDRSAVTALTEYLDATPKNPPRPSRAEAQMIVDARTGGGGK